MHRLAHCLALGLVLVTSPLATRRAAAATVTDFYDTVDFAEADQRNCSFNCRSTLTVQGILVGGSSVVTRTYVFQQGQTLADNFEVVQHCHRLALLAMSKPGKFQFAVGPLDFPTSCRLKRIVP
jgi:hypothetical protein